MNVHPTVAAFFDVDYTVLNASSGVLYVKYMCRHGRMGHLDMQFLRSLVPRNSCRC